MQTYRHHGDRISLTFIFQYKESRLKKLKSGVYNSLPENNIVKWMAKALLGNDSVNTLKRMQH
jgi:hypothetical protein